MRLYSSFTCAIYLLHTNILQKLYYAVNEEKLFCILQYLQNGQFALCLYVVNICILGRFCSIRQSNEFLPLFFCSIRHKLVFQNVSYLEKYMYVRIQMNFNEKY